MNSLVEFMTRVKGIEYLLALGFLFSFVGFWQWHHNRSKGIVRSVAPLAVIATIFGILASVVILSPAASINAQESLSVDQAHYLANSYGPAKFAAHGMSPDVISCQTCHHHSPDGQPQACSTCHKEPFDGEGTDKPGLKAAYHQRCQDCHKDAFSGPLTCTNCHTEQPDATATNVKAQSPSKASAPDIAHELRDSFSNCFSCHSPEGQLPLPGNHKDYKANVQCLGCHQPSATTPGMSIPAVQKKEAPQAAPETEKAVTTAAQAATSNPAKISHPVQGRENCTACHQVGGALKPMPTDHAARANGTCQACHKAS